MTDSKRSKYRKEEEEVKTVVKDLLFKNEEQWKLCKEWVNGKVYYRKSPSTSGNIYKAVFEVNIGLEKAMQSIFPEPRGFRNKWDTNLDRSEILEDLDEDAWVMLSLTKPQMAGWISAREFIDVIFVERMPGNRVIACAKSIEHPSVPKKRDLVRGHNYPCGSFYEVLDGDRVRISVMYHSDIGGRVPKRIVEKALPSVMQSDVEALFSHLKTAA